MTFNFRLFWRMAIRSFNCSAKKNSSPLTHKRLVFLLLFFVIWPVLAGCTWICFLLDDVFFPGYRKQPIEKPLFVLSNFRSGSTMVQRVLARDQNTFTTLRACDIFLMPSITQRRLLRFLVRADALFGNPLMKAARKFDSALLGKVRIHSISLFAPEEDETILLYAWSSFFVGFLFPFLDELPPYQFFDDAIPKLERQRIMGFYRACVQRHLYATSGGSANGRYFVAKNPAFSPKIETLLELFPDARILYLVRNPLDMLPSTISWLSYAWHVSSDPPEKYPYRDEILALARYWYDHPLAVLDKNPNARHLILRYEDLIERPDAIFRGLYRRFGYPQSGELEQILRDAVAEARAHVSMHNYNYEEMGFTREQIVREFADIFERFRFDTRDDVASKQDLRVPIIEAQPQTATAVPRAN
jgi:omega-hydroxy-beta-dihydromenaquinone-9 sulfotransferase